MALPNFANVFIDFTWLDIQIILEKDDIIIIIFFTVVTTIFCFRSTGKETSSKDVVCWPKSLSACEVVATGREPAGGHRLASQERRLPGLLTATR